MSHPQFKGACKKVTQINLSLPVGTANTYSMWEQMIPYSLLGGTSPHGCPASLMLRVVDIDFAPLVTSALASVKWA